MAESKVPLGRVFKPHRDIFCLPENVVFCTVQEMDTTMLYPLAATILQYLVTSGGAPLKPSQGSGLINEKDCTYRVSCTEESLRGGEIGLQDPIVLTFTFRKEKIVGEKSEQPWKLAAKESKQDTTD